MEETGNYPAMTLAPDGSHCLFGTSFLNSAENAGLVKFDFASKKK